MLAPMEQFNMLILRTHASTRLLSKCVACTLTIMQIAIVAMGAALNSTASAAVVEPGQFGAPLQVSSNSGAPTRTRAVGAPAKTPCITGHSEANYNCGNSNQWNVAKSCANDSGMNASTRAVNVSNADQLHLQRSVAPKTNYLWNDKDYFGVFK
jgi:hypothetical protein